MSLNIYTSNRMERLVEALARAVAPPLSSPFVPETIVVQSAGMQRWLAMQLAARFGSGPNCRYPFPNAMVRQLFAASPGDSGILGLYPGGHDLEDHGASSRTARRRGVCSLAELS